MAMLALAVCAPEALAQDPPEELVLRTALANDLTQQALRGIIEPIGGLLGRISPSSSYATANRGLGYGAVSIGVTALQFEITDPDYTKVDAAGNAGTLDGPAAAAFADFEIGLFEGYGKRGKTNNVGSLDLLIRLGASLGDQNDLAEKIDTSSWAPIFGGGLRLGLLRGENFPSISVSAGVNRFTERTFRVLGDVDGEPFEVAFDLDQTSAFVLAEIGKQWGGYLPFLGVGRVWHDLEARYRANVVVQGGEAQIDNPVDVSAAKSLLFGGVELGSGFFRIVLEAGSSSGEPYGTFFFKVIPFPG
jgi:hypothetical protein